ncbi:dioxygenase [Aureococcus anophagefferens]|nr:dioxygenase [Aureococcus anophagefferens]
MIDALEAAAWAVAGAAAVGALRRRLRRSAAKPTLRRFPATAKFDDIWAAYERDGAVIVEDMLSPETLAKLRDETEASFRATAPGTAARRRGRGRWLHRDAENWGHFCDGPKSIPVTVSCMFAVTDFKAETGATRVAPGSHGWRDFRTEARPDQILQAEMKAGSGLIYSGKVVHSGGANATADEWRGAASILFSRARRRRARQAPRRI